MNKSLKLIFLSFGIVCPVRLFSQTYAINQPVKSPANQGGGSGYFEVNFSDPANAYGPSAAPGTGFNPTYNPYPNGSAGVTFGTATGTLVYNPVALTYDFSGAVALTSGTGVVSFTDNQLVGGTYVPANITVNYTVGNGTSLSFNSGVVSISTGTMYLSVPVSGSYTFSSGGNNYTGSIAYSMQIPMATSFSSVTPSSLTLTQTGQPISTASTTLAQATAGDGAAMSLSNESSDTATYSGWYLNGPLLAVPEPSSTSLFGFAGAGFFLYSFLAKPKRQAN